MKKWCLDGPLATQNQGSCYVRKKKHHPQISLGGMACTREASVAIHALKYALYDFMKNANCSNCIACSVWCDEDTKGWAYICLMTIDAIM